MKECIFDWETASQCDLLKAGAWRYAEDPTTEILCLNYQIDNGPVTTWVPGQSIPAVLEMALRGPKVLFVAQNAAFEKAILRRIAMPQYGWPDVPNERWHDPQAVCAMKQLPLKLERANLVLGLHEQKDMEGSRAVKEASKFDKRGNSRITPQLLETIYAYGKQDIRAERELAHRIGSLAGERPVWLLDQRINERGVGIDMQFVGACERIIRDASAPLVGEFASLTGFKPGQRDAVLKWVRDQGVNLDNLQKGTLTKILGAEDEDDEDMGDYDTDDAPVPDLPPNVRRALEIRRTLGSASIKKLARIHASVGMDDRVRGVLQYHGAGPGRWSGRLFQPQNFPRPTLTSNDGRFDIPEHHENIYAALATGDHEYVASVLGDPITAVVSGLRHAILAAPGRTLDVGDFATIEARIVLALAGQHDKTALMAGGKDIYCDMAEAIYGRPCDKKKTPEDRQTGKNSVLGLGFQMGAPKFRARYAANESIEFAQKVVNTYRKTWAPLVPKLWNGEGSLEYAALRTVWDRKPHEAFGVLYALDDMWLTARLPSGRKLYYPNPKPVRKAMPWSTPDEPDIRPAWTCNAWKGGRWITRDMYGGLLTENVVQALARDLMVEVMFKCEASNLPVILTVHDEIVAEPLKEHSDHVMLEQIMADRPQWAIDLQIPVAAETWSGDRYRK